MAQKFNHYPNRINTDTFVTRDGIQFHVHSVTYRQIIDVPEYYFENIRNSDRVIDIGANVGAFCLRAARFTPHITAVEPVTTDILEENITINRLTVKTLKGALGTGKSIVIDWDGYTVTVPSFSLKQIVDFSGGCDFLKCDAEGAEWSIDPKDLDGIRRIEMELHIPPIGPLPNNKILEYISDHYEFTIDRKPVYTPLGVLGILHAERKDERK